MNEKDISNTSITSTIENKETSAIDEIKDVEQIYERSKYYENQASYKIAFQLCEKAAKLGYAPAQNALAIMYEDGKVCRKDEEKAIYWYNSAIIKGDTNAIYNLGIYFQKYKKYSEAIEVFERIKDIDDPDFLESLAEVNYEIKNYCATKYLARKCIDLINPGNTINKGVDSTGHKDRDDKNNGHKDKDKEDKDKDKEDRDRDKDHKEDENKEDENGNKDHKDKEDENGNKDKENRDKENKDERDKDKKDRDGNKDYKDKEDKNGNKEKDKEKDSDNEDKKNNKNKIIARCYNTLGSIFINKEKCSCYLRRNNASEEPCGHIIDYSIAIDHFRKAAEYSCIKAYYNLSYLLDPVLKEPDMDEKLYDENESLKYYKLAANNGYTSCQWNLYVHYRDKNDLEEANKWLKMAAERGNKDGGRKRQ